MTLLSNEGMKEKIIAEYVLNIIKSAQVIEDFKTVLGTLGLEFKD